VTAWGHKNIIFLATSSESIRFTTCIHAANSRISAREGAFLGQWDINFSPTMSVNMLTTEKVINWQLGQVYKQDVQYIRNQYWCARPPAPPSANVDWYGVQTMLRCGVGPVLTARNTNDSTNYRAALWWQRIEPWNCSSCDNIRGKYVEVYGGVEGSHLNSETDRREQPTPFALTGWSLVMSEILGTISSQYKHSSTGRNWEAVKFYK
jgi:hypothetical protein